MKKEEHITQDLALTSPHPNHPSAYKNLFEYNFSFAYFCSSPFTFLLYSLSLVIPLFFICISGFMLVLKFSRNELCSVIDKDRFISALKIRVTNMSSFNTSGIIPGRRQARFSRARYEGGKDDDLVPRPLSYRGREQGSCGESSLALSFSVSISLWFTSDRKSVV